MSHSCENYDTSDPVVLTIEGVYKHGENEALTVSQNVVFKDIQRDGSGNITSQDIIPIQRNHLYKVILTPKYNNGALVFDEIDYAIQVNDWQTGETLVFAGNTNLTATSTPDFEATEGISSVVTTEADGKTNPTTIVTPTVHATTVKLKVTSATTGTMLSCPEFDSSKGRYDIISTTNDANGNLVEIYQIDIYENVLTNESFTFTIHNAISTALSRSFLLSAAPFRNKTNDIQYGDVYYANGMWSRAADYAACSQSSNPVGVVAPVAAKKTGDTDLSASFVAKPYSGITLGDVYYAAGFWSSPTSSVINACKTASSSNPIGIITYKNEGTAISNQYTEKDTKATGIGGHALVMALTDANSATSVVWATTTGNGSTTDESYLTNIPATNSAAIVSLTLETDVSGYTNTVNLVNCSGHDHQAAKTAKNYSVSCPTLSTGWFLPSAAQWVVSYGPSGVGGGSWASLIWANWCWMSARIAMDNALSKVSGATTITKASGAVIYWGSNEQEATRAVGFFVENRNNTGYDYGFSMGNNNENPKTVSNPNRYYVRSFLAF